jgi:hypothetical protein
MIRERSHELEERRNELTRSMPGLSAQKDSTYRINSDALALDRAGVKHEAQDEMVRLGEAAAAADGAIRDAQRELRNVYEEIERLPKSGLGGRFGRAVRRRRADR